MYSNIGSQYFRSGRNRFLDTVSVFAPTEYDRVQKRQSIEEDKYLEIVPYLDTGGLALSPVSLYSHAASRAEVGDDLAATKRQSDIGFYNFHNKNAVLEDPVDRMIDGEDSSEVQEVERLALEA
ncbi:ATP-grasp fold subdomain 1 [Penicillium cf. viridicatum]|uniref:ATP-grasp fold subdomain 1 n=1 Tax=Penicillium cf. viridicatum TaxID=2972119 RepID=A0A9W9JDN4_9EURO|nr:ATP-grasp fold subdomain 1 [Penicillium cf. viridicatum]